MRFRFDIFVSLLERLYNHFSENQATGVAYTLNPIFHPDGSKDTHIVRGTKLVLVSAGAFGSPGIVERSGIGVKDVLERVGVKQRVELPGVGNNYQGFCDVHLGSFVFDIWLSMLCLDHNVVAFRYFAADEAQSLDGVIFRREEGAIDGMSSLPPSVPVGATRLATIPQPLLPSLERLRKRS